MNKILEEINKELLHDIKREKEHIYVSGVLFGILGKDIKAVTDKEFADAQKKMKKMFNNSSYDMSMFKDYLG